MTITNEEQTRDEPTAAEYKRKLAIRDSALIEVRAFVASLKLGVTVKTRDAMVALLDRAMSS